MIKHRRRRDRYIPLCGFSLGEQLVCGGEMHKSFDADKAPDPPSGRIDDIVGVLQIVPALVGNQGIAEPTGLDSLKNPFLIHAGVKLLIGIPSFHWRYGKAMCSF